MATGKAKEEDDTAGTARREKVDLEKFLKIMPASNLIIILLGLAFVTAYSEIWSLFSGVAVWSNYILILFSMVVMFADGKIIGKQVVIEKNIKTLVYIILIILFAYGTSRGYMHYDTNLYHAQAIRWIEQYGIVPGLANLQSRFGYNSAEFALNALYSWQWVLGQSLHCSAGFFALISSMLLVDISPIWSAKDETGKRIINIRLSDYVRLGLLFYLGIIYSEMISPASDYYAQLLIFDTVIIWLDNLDKAKREKTGWNEYNTTAIQTLLCIILVYAITIKLSIGLLVLLAIVPGLYLVKNKKYLAVAAATISGLIIAIPYFIRNYIISGWILYPSTLVKIGSPDWQLPKGEAQYDAKEIGMWGRGITRAEDWDKVTAFNWIPNWFGKLANLEKMWVIGALISALIILAIIILYIVSNVKKDMKSALCLQIKSDKDLVILLSIILLGSLFWFLSAPLVRYGYAYLVILSLLLAGYISGIIVRVCDRKTVISAVNIVYVVMALIFILLKARGLVNDIVRTRNEDYYSMQQDYIDGDAFTYDVSGVKIYVAEDSGQIGYYKFPATPNEKTDFELRGEDISQGFRHLAK